MLLCLYNSVNLEDLAHRQGGRVIERPFLFSPLSASLFDDDRPQLLCEMKWRRMMDFVIDHGLLDTLAVCVD